MATNNPEINADTIPMDVISPVPNIPPVIMVQPAKATNIAMIFLRSTFSLNINREITMM